MDIRFPVGVLFVSYGILLVVYSFAGGEIAPRHMLAGVSVNLATGVAMLVFGGIFVGLSRRGGSRIRRAMVNPEGRSIEEWEKRTGLEQ